MSFSTPAIETNTHLSTDPSSEKTTINHHLITPPRSVNPSTPTSPHDHHDKSAMVNKHIEHAAGFITSTWHPVQSLFTHTPSHTVGFIKYLTEILKRSRCSMSALNGALFYLHKLTTMIQAGNEKLLQCPKKVFLVCLILSFKFQYDSTYNLKAWSRISGLAVKELKQLEMGILGLLNYRLSLNNEEYRQWNEGVEACVKKSQIESETIVVMISCGSKRGRGTDDAYVEVKKAKVSCA